MRVLTWYCSGSPDVNTLNVDARQHDTIPPSKCLLNEGNLVRITQNWKYSMQAIFGHGCFISKTVENGKIVANQASRSQFNRKPKMFD